MRSRRLLLWIALAIAHTTLALGCAPHSGDEDASDESAAVVPVTVARVELKEFSDVVEAPGQWRSSGDVVLPAPFAAVVESLGPRPGDPVAAGAVLGVLLTRDSRAALRGAELLVHEARDDAARAEAERALALARRDLVRVPLVAPRAGIVTRRGAEPGTELAEGTEVLAITPPDGIVFEARVPVAQASRVRVGAGARVRAEGAPDVAAHVTRVLPAASGADQAVLVWIAPDAVGARAPLLDRFGTAALRVGATRRAPAAPGAAVVESDLDGSARVAVVGADSVATWTRVTLGAEADGWRELKGAALAPGAWVVVEGARGLADHARVRMDTAPADSAR